MVFDPEKSRLILDPLISKDPALKLTSGEGSGSSRRCYGALSIKLPNARRRSASPPPRWNGSRTLPFASQSDYAKAIANVLTVWNLKSQTEAAGWLQNSALNPTLKADLLKAGPALKIEEELN